MESNGSRWSRLFILLGAGVWLGGFIMLGYGVAPVNFGIAQQWELDGMNPAMPEQPVSYRTIGGELTGTSIVRLNVMESFSLFLIVIGMVLAWNTRSATDRNLIIRTVLVLIAVGAFYYYAVRVGGRLTELRTTVPIDFSVTESAMKSAAHLEFDRLHQTYTRVAGFTMGVLFVLFGLTIFDQSPADKASKTKS
ncbi:hypothetical protein CYPRO_1142 [Cyclonatronum proteinivorum]|uniref:DUF4149 domain-containing protein n=1 Tax=Cyclonatronum proteinivorum TaxID=1457365 RepID=A0A345UIV5_9BACT|nr:hypothetical protein [Cyclonatronum proteinivorum]AXJ00407.1 hypothetical protein CYPRO_1142 [Cyclonatronum proteinivorum]